MACIYWLSIVPFALEAGILARYSDVGPRASGTTEPIYPIVRTSAVSQLICCILIWSCCCKRFDNAHAHAMNILNAYHK